MRNRFAIKEILVGSIFYAPEERRLLFSSNESESNMGSIVSVRAVRTGS